MFRRLLKIIAVLYFRLDCGAQRNNSELICPLYFASVIVCYETMYVRVVYMFAGVGFSLVPENNLRDIKYLKLNM